MEGEATHSYTPEQEDRGASCGMEDYVLYEGQQLLVDEDTIDVDSSCGR